MKDSLPIPFEDDCFDYRLRPEHSVPNEEHSVMSHAPNPILSIRQKLELDRVRVTRGRDGEVAKIGIKTDDIDLSTIAALMMQPVKHEMVFENGKLHARGSMDRLFHHTLCPEIEVVSSFLFQHAGHIWKESHSNWHSIGITGVVELYIPAGRGARISEFSDITKQTSQSGRNETMAMYLDIGIPDTIEDGPVPIAQDLFNRLKAGGHLLPNGNVDLSGTFHWDHRTFESNLGPAEGEPEVLTPEDIADREQAMQEASEGKLDYLLEGTQWDPRNRK